MAAMEINFLCKIIYQEQHIFRLFVAFSIILFIFDRGRKVFAPSRSYTKILCAHTADRHRSISSI